MAIRFEISQTIEQPIDKVFAFLSNFSNMPSWNYFIQSVRKISPGKDDIGSVFEMKRPRDMYLYKITGFNPPNKIVVELQPPGPNQQIIFDLVANSKHTEVAYTWSIDLAKFKALKYLPEGLFKRLLLSIPHKLILSKTKPAVEENFIKMKELLETGQVTLQNGRHIVLPDQVP